jgi:hypothetical protein
MDIGEIVKVDISHKLPESTGELANNQWLQSSQSENEERGSPALIISYGRRKC